MDRLCRRPKAQLLASRLVISWYPLKWRCFGLGMPGKALFCEVELGVRRLVGCNGDYTAFLLPRMSISYTVVTAIIELFDCCV